MHIPFHILEELGLSVDIIRAKGLPAWREATDLRLAHISKDGREFLLVPEAVKAWREMQDAAEKDGEMLVIVSAFRSVVQQAELIREQLSRGASMQETMFLCAPPGFSEHHTGCAIDVASKTPGAYGKKFDTTTAYAWMERFAGEFGFTLSYPHGNPYFQYEPWHWRHETAHRYEAFFDTK